MTTARTRSHRPGSPAPPVRSRSPYGEARNRLPWWGAVLPVLAFSLLLALLLGGSEAGAAQRTESPGGELLVAVLERVGHALLG